ncbi:hypothetical protein M404DRAFT_23872 [Pisolithus tinctorius Marx 270]|uniref:Uncharacterized protein n=1 Tax=Pisolithus tinctorius Marx 270 TaxID=870435 RepID=A0A0C3PGB0_PISTI|nr:hypothetical protein M404DRAFT_23872 [Pisolithus tinctorius Marx 270]
MEASREEEEACSSAINMGGDAVIGQEQGVEREQSPDQVQANTRLVEKAPPFKEAPNYP